MEQMTIFEKMMEVRREGYRIIKTYLGMWYVKLPNGLMMDKIEYTTEAAAYEAAFYHMVKEG